MLNKKIFVLFCVFSVFFLNTVNASNCVITTCQDIKPLSLECSVVYLGSNVTTAGQTCFYMGGQVFDLNSYTIFANGDNDNNDYAISVTGSGEIRNGYIVRYGTTSANLGIGVSSQTGNVVIDNVNITDIQHPIRISSGEGIVYIRNSYIKGIGVYGDVIDVSNDLDIYNTTITGGANGILYNNNFISTRFEKTQIGGLGSGINAQKTGIVFNIASLRVCGNTQDLLLTNSPSNTSINNQGNQFYYDILSGNYTLSGNPKRDCYEYQGFYDEGGSSNESLSVCDSSSYTSLEDIGLYDFTIMKLYNFNGEVDRYGIKVKIRNETLYNNLGINSNKVCLYKLGSSFYYCQNAVYASSMYDKYNDNLGSYNRSEILQLQHYTINNIFDDLIYTYIESTGYYKKELSSEYCNHNNYDCVLGFCTCKGYYYEILADNLESGEYGVYLEIKQNINDTDCLFKIYSDKVDLKGSLELNLNENGLLDNIPVGENINDYQEVKVSKKIYSSLVFENLSNNDLCNITVYTFGYESLKASDIIFYLTANTSTNVYSQSDVIEMKQSEYDANKKYYFTKFDICKYNLSFNQIGVFTLIKDNTLNKFVEVENMGYTGTVNRTENGTSANIYYYIDNTTTINYGNDGNITTGLRVDDIYYKKIMAGMDFFTILLIILIAFIMIYSIVILFANRKK